MKHGGIIFRHVFAILVTLLTILPPASSRAADFPGSTVRFIVPQGAGSATDTLARQMARWLEVKWNQPVIVENRPGAGGIVATDYVVKQPPDGYTLLLTGASIVISPLIYKNVSFSLERDMSLVARLGVLRIVLATNTSVPAQTLQEFAALSRANPGKMNYGGLGRTSVIDTGLEAIKRGLRMDLTPIEYKNVSDYVTALIRNDVQLIWGGAMALKGQRATGKVRLLAAVAEHRFPDLPDVPTVVEAGYTNYIPKAWTGLIAPAATPPAILDQINRDVNSILARPDSITMLQNSIGNDPAPLSREAFLVEVKTEARFWAELFKELKIEPQ